MKKFLSIAVFALSGLAFQAQAQHKHTEESKATPSAVKGQVYGEDIEEKNTVKGKDFDRQLKGENPVRMQVKGTVTGVCKARGCWATVDIGDGKELFVKMKDYGFFLPMDAKGKQVLLSGDAFVETHSVDDLREKARSQKKSEAEVEKITNPEDELRFTAHGITILN
ncbi:MAG: hypothetical protein BGO31_18335 [Bacteroidetes bacterium 43-16]|nr:MAG: hypothetical protein BGO31_18335 [Bacteroidetes bacterium 43-16]